MYESSEETFYERNLTTLWACLVVLGLGGYVLLQLSTWSRNLQVALELAR